MPTVVFTVPISLLSSQLEDLEKEGQIIDRNNYIFVGRYPHLQAIQARLDFIRFTLDYSSARLTSIRADLLWETLVMGAITPEEADKILIWFFRCASFCRFYACC